MPKYRNTPSTNISLYLATAIVSLASISVFAADADVPQQQSLSPGMRVRILAPGLFPSKLIGTVDQVGRLTCFPGRAKQEVSPEASMDGFTASRKTSNDPRSKVQLIFNLLPQRAFGRPLFENGAVRIGHLLHHSLVSKQPRE
jgi:hypothetical protein